MGGVVEVATCEGEVSGSNLADREARDFTQLATRQWAFPELWKENVSRNVLTSANASNMTSYGPNWI
jgi:hypothetical protein